MNILVLSTFDIWPPKDGGQNRYVELWKNMSRVHEVVILAYEFRNTVARRTYRLGPNVRVIVPIAAQTDADLFAVAAGRSGLWLHDILCVEQYRFSDDFLSCLREQLNVADVVVASHPYLAHLAFPFAKANAIKVYEAYNVELDIKAEYLAGCRDDVLAIDLVSDTAWIERYAVKTADLVTAVSAQDRDRLCQLHAIQSRKATVVPNGTNTCRATLDRYRLGVERKTSFGLSPQLAGIFLGSAFQPNVISYERARTMLDEIGFSGSMLLLGSIVAADRSKWPDVGFQEVWLGFVDDDVRDGLLRSADFALHLIFAGAGTNLKLFDYMGSGLPVVCNQRGRRGYDGGEIWFFDGETNEALKTSLETIARDPDEAARRGNAAYRVALDHFSWPAIARKMEAIITSCDQNRAFS